MAHQSSFIESDIAAYLKSNERNSLLRFITCGGVDDGKSTLIDRLLIESNRNFDDQLATLESDSMKPGVQPGEIDSALLVDGLAYPQDQGVAFDVTYRYFSTDKRKFIVADTPGHEQYTRNMVTGASTADLAIILVDARLGILAQTKLHSFIVSLLGIQNVVLAVNKMDLVGYDQSIFDEIVSDYHVYARRLREDGQPPFDIVPVPLSALKGEHILEASGNMPWFDGKPLLKHLEEVEVQHEDTSKPFRMPVQRVNQPNSDFGGYSGQISSGSISVGELVNVMPSAKQTTLKSISTMDGSLDTAFAGQSVTLCLSAEIDISRGDVICSQAEPAEVANQFVATILWMSEDTMLPGRSYIFKSGIQTAGVTITVPKHKINVDTNERLPATKLELNEIGECNIAVDRKIIFDPYEKHKDMGGFILIDRQSNATVGMGMLRFALRRSSNIHWQTMDVSKETRSQMKAQKPAVLWFTGLSGSGKSTIANHLEKKLTALGKHTYLLDGDNIRHGLNKDLGFSDADRVENIRRITEVSKLMVDAGLITLVSFISPFRSERKMARAVMSDGEFLEIFVDTPLEVAEKRDVKGLYKKARAGELKNFTGIDSPYEAPQNAEIVVNTAATTAEQAAETILDELEKRELLG